MRLQSEGLKVAEKQLVSTRCICVVCVVFAFIGFGCEHFERGASAHLQSVDLSDGEAALRGSENKRVLVNIHLSFDT